MRKLNIAVFATALSILMSGCTGAPVYGALFTHISAPVTATTNTSAIKEGEGSCMSVLGLVAAGDCSIATAAKEAGITRIMSVDHRFNSFLIIFSKYTVVVKGE